MNRPSDSKCKKGIMLRVKHSILICGSLAAIIPCRGAASVEPVCTSCVVPVGLGAAKGALFSDFETPPFTGSRIGTDWFSFNDGEGRYSSEDRAGTSAITRGARIDTADPSIRPQLIIKGNGRIGNGASIDFTIGKPFYEISALIPTQPFVGLAVRLANDNGDAYDMSADGCQGVYFEYRLSGAGIQTVRFEARAYQPDWPSSFDAHRIWWNVNLPATNGEWKGAQVLLADLVFPEEGKLGLDSARRALDLKSMTYLQWSITAAPGSNGSLSLDNVHLIGAKQLTPLPSGIRGQHRNRTWTDPPAIRFTGHGITVEFPERLRGKGVLMTGRAVRAE